MMEKKLALGHQEFSEVIENNCIYVDKTEIIYKLITREKYCFLSRPRRFGKSLIANTIKEVFNANKELFKSLWIYDKWNWEKTNPVIKISFSNIDYATLGLRQAINNQLNTIAESHLILLEMNSVATKFQELITKLSAQTQVVIIIDEYDKPIIDYMDNVPQAEENRDILKNFYSVLKDADKHLRFLFITGVSKFSQVSIFSDLNNLTDITIDKNYSQITGWTKEEIERYFPDYINRAAQEYDQTFEYIMQQIKYWYNGYSWDGNTRVHNPVSVMNFLSKREFRNYWFSTGTPTFLMKLIKNQELIAFDIENSYTTNDILDRYDFKDINFNSLLFQTGYLTIKSNNIFTRRIVLDYPNNEVAESFSKNILNTQTFNNIDKTQTLLFKITDSFLANDIQGFIDSVNYLFKNISYHLAERKESYYHSLFYLIMKLLGFNIQVEIETIDGRIDAVIKTPENIYIIEFKIDQSAEKAIEQIKYKNYALAYAQENKKICLLGINFETAKHKIEDYKLVVI